MINWLTDYIGTGAYLKVTNDSGDMGLVDVRNLVDKDGNTSEAINTKINESLDQLKKYGKVVVCCDYGMSRSNSIAAGVIAKYESIPFSQAVSLVQKKAPEEGIKLEVLNAVFRALNPNLSSTGSNENRVLMTGGTGFIGSQLSGRLAKSLFVKALSGKDVDLIHNPVLLDLLVKENNITTLVHLANPRIYTVNIAMGDSLVMLKNVLEVCRLNKLKLIYVSSWEVYSGYKAEELLADEKLPLFPVGAYGETKWMSEQLIEHYHKNYELPYVLLRSSPVYGEHSDKPKFIHNFIDRAKKNEPIATHKYLNGFPKLDLLYLDDFIGAAEKAVNFNGTGIFNIGSGKTVNTKAIAEQIARIFNSTSTISSTEINGYYPNIRIDYSKAKNVLNWEPKGSFEDFLKKMQSQP